MISFLSNWIQQIALSAIIVSVFELILPQGNIKKYIKVVLGIYIIFCIISPFVTNFKLYKLEDLNLENNIEEPKYKEETTTQASMDSRLQELYLQELKSDLQKKVEENGYKMLKCDIDAELKSTSKNPGIHKIDLVITKENTNIENIEVNIKQTTEKPSEQTPELENLKENLANYYEVNKDIINIKIK